MIERKERKERKERSQKSAPRGGLPIFPPFLQRAVKSMEDPVKTFAQNG